MLTRGKRSQFEEELGEDEGSSSRGWAGLSLLWIIWQRKIFILATWTVLCAAVLTTVALWPATYRAETLILVDSQKIPEKFVSATVSMELQDRLATLSQTSLRASPFQTSKPRN